MISEDESYRIAFEFLKDYLVENPDVALIRERVEDAGDFYLIYYNTREAIADPDNGYGLAGNWPVRVDKSTGVACHTEMNEFVDHLKAAGTISP